MAEPAAGQDLSAAETPVERIRYVGDYELLEELGRGAMGVVYKARQITLNRGVAVKLVLTGAHASQSELDRFAIEAQAAARLHHPNIVGIHEIGVHHGSRYYSMELIVGGSLAACLQNGAFAPGEAAELVATLADAVQYAHQRGVLHRDLKPSNVLLDAAGRPHITDFGLAKLLDDKGGMTRAGDIMGTPAYMPPEQASGALSQVGPTADVYSLGAILYELLTGRQPFTGESAADTLLQVLQSEPTRPSKLRPNLPTELEAICMRCLEKRPADRYPVAAELAADLRRFLAGEPIQARGPSRWRRAVTYIERRPWAIAGILSFASLALMWFGYGMAVENGHLRWLVANPGAELPDELASSWLSILDPRLLLPAFVFWAWPNQWFRRRARRRILDGTRLRSWEYGLFGGTSVLVLLVGVGLGFTVIDQYARAHSAKLVPAARRTAEALPAPVATVVPWGTYVKGASFPLFELIECLLIIWGGGTLGLSVLKERRFAYYLTRTEEEEDRAAASREVEKETAPKPKKTFHFVGALATAAVSALIVLLCTTGDLLNEGLQPAEKKQLVVAGLLAAALNLVGAALLVAASRHRRWVRWGYFLLVLALIAGVLTLRGRVSRTAVSITLGTGIAVGIAGGILIGLGWRERKARRG